MNKNNERRLELLKPYLDDDNFGGITKFKNLPHEVLKQLVDEGFADPDSKQNDSPSIYEFFAFMKNYTEFTAHGYIVHPERDDYRVSVEGIEAPEKLPPEQYAAFVAFARHADEFELDPPRCWWD